MQAKSAPSARRARFCLPTVVIGSVLSLIAAPCRVWGVRRQPEGETVTTDLAAGRASKLQGTFSLNGREAIRLEDGRDGEDRRRELADAFGDPARSEPGTTTPSVGSTATCSDGAEATSRSPRRSRSRPFGGDPSLAGVRRQVRRRDMALLDRPEQADRPLPAQDRQRRRHLRLVVRDIGSDTPAPDRAVGDRDAIVRALRQLPDIERTALVLRYLDDLSVRDVAAMLGRSVDGTDALIRRAKERFRSIHPEAFDD